MRPAASEYPTHSNEVGQKPTITAFTSKHHGDSSTGFHLYQSVNNGDYMFCHGRSYSLLWGYATILCIMCMYRRTCTF